MDSFSLYPQGTATFFHNTCYIRFTASLLKRTACLCVDIWSPNYSGNQFKKLTVYSDVPKCANFNLVNAIPAF